MSSINTRSKVKVETTHAGGKAKTFTPLEELKRIAFTCYLWEPKFYKSGEETAERISALVDKVKTEDLEKLVVDARVRMKIRHLPLFILTRMLKNDSHRKVVRRLCGELIKRPDDATELLSMYWRDGKAPLSAQLKRGIAATLPKFNPYQLAKYQNKGAAVGLRDLFNLTRPKPKNDEQAATWKLFMKEGLPAPFTWEVEISKHGNKREVWEKLIAEKALGPVAFLRNIRNMSEAGVEKKTLVEKLSQLDASELLPTLLLSAARNNPQFEKQVEVLFDKAFAQKKRLPGKTTVLVDVSGSMDSALSEKSEVTQMDAACGVAMILGMLCDEVRVFTFSQDLVEVPSRRGFALRDAIVGSQQHGGTYLGGALQKIPKDFDRLVVVTDEQSGDTSTYAARGKDYIINVAPYSKGVEFGDWTRINGFSDAVIDFISEVEQPRAES